MAFQNAAHRTDSRIIWQQFIEVKKDMGVLVSSNITRPSASIHWDDICGDIPFEAANAA